jgi:hypothetical protein
MSEAAKIVPEGVDSEKQPSPVAPVLEKRSSSISSVLSEKTKVEEHVLAYDKRSW